MVEHWIWLTTRKYIGTRGCVQLIEKFGSAERIYAMSREEYIQAGLRKGRAMDSLEDKSLDESWDII